jgi:Rrf2 family protein
MFSQTVEYALRAIVHLAYEAPEARTTAQLAEATLVPRDYLSKILQQLARAGIVTTQRGVGGGVSLARGPAELTILDVVRGVEPESVKRTLSCPLGLKAHGARLCPLHKRLDDAVALVEQVFGGTTLAQILAEPSESVPLCDTADAQALKVRGR